MGKNEKFRDVSDVMIETNVDNKSKILNDSTSSVVEEVNKKDNKEKNKNKKVILNE